MEIIKTIKDGQAILNIKGRLDTLTAPKLEAEINLIDEDKLILDLDELEYISSAGLRVILSAHKQFLNASNMIIKNVNEAVMEVFKITGFDDILNIE